MSIMVPASSTPLRLGLDDESPEADVGNQGHTNGASRVGLLAMAVAVFLGRLAYSLERTVFHLSPDEPATLGMARWMSGAGSWNMFAADVWRPGTALLLAPLFWLTDDQSTIVRLSLVLLAAVAAWSAVWLARIVRRLTDVSPNTALVISGAVALMPASLSASAYVWAEPLVTLTFLASLWHVMAHVEHPSTRHVTAAVAWASFGLVVHNRLMPMLALVLVIVVVRALRAGRRRQALAGVGVTVVIVGSGQSLTAIVTERVWEDPATTNTVGATLRRIGDPLAVLDAAAGQLWYLLASTALLFGIGVITLVRTALRATEPRRTAARTVLAASGVLIATSIVFMSDRVRTDQLVYGRYNDAVVWPVVAVGAAWLWSALASETSVARRWTLLAPLASCAGLTLVLVALHGDELERFPAFTTMIAGLQPVMSRSYLIEPPLVAVAAFAAFAVLLLASRVRGVLAAVVVAVLLLAAGQAARHTVAPRVNVLQRSDAVADLEGSVIPTGSTVGVRFTPDWERPPVPLAVQATYWYLYQWLLDDMTFATDAGLEDGVGPYVFSTVDDPAMVEAGAARLWTDPASPLALWLEPTGSESAHSRFSQDEPTGLDQ